ncbi:MAG TPA: pirin family protein [Kineobactrum sp.]
MPDRIIQETIMARPSRDGDGVAIQRITATQPGTMDPILMLDELYAARREDLGGGFPAHPHRGMQTLTYMKHGGLVHQDNRGNRGEIRGGGAQWMSAGRGIIHSEMPTQDTQGLHGFQLWINLPAAEKMSEPRYRDLPADELATISGEGYHAIAIAGDWQLAGATVTGPLHELAPRAAVLDLQLEAGSEITLSLPPSESLLAYIYTGTVVSGVRELTTRHLLVTSRGHRWTVQAGDDGAALLLLRGEPLREPVAQYGPFVMNTSAEIEQAIQDYRNGGFA